MYVAPEITEARNIQILHFPDNSINIDEPFDFVIKKNDAHGNVEAKVSKSKMQRLQNVTKFVFS